MSGESSSAAEWFTRLEPAVRPDLLPRRPDDPRLGEVVEFWDGDPSAIRLGRPVLIGFPQDEGVRRNGGRVGAAEAPREIRRFLYRLTPWDVMSNTQLAEDPPLDVGDVRIDGTMEHSQQMLGGIVSEVLKAGAVPVVIGGGHETAFGHFLGYAKANQFVGIINIDAHLDLRPEINGMGHSGSPFRQAIEHSPFRLFAENYICIGAQPQSVSREHWRYAKQRNCNILWNTGLRPRIADCLTKQIDMLRERECHVYLTVDADAVRLADVPGVSAPSVLGLAGDEVIQCVRLAGRSAAVSSFDLVEINPRFDRDGQSCRWAALAIWHFLMGLAQRRAADDNGSSKS
jgi:formiminoglutamase